jgi:hypothetical protein
VFFVVYVNVEPVPTAMHQFLEMHETPSSFDRGFTLKALVAPLTVAT